MQIKVAIRVVFRDAATSQCICSASTESAFPMQDWKSEFVHCAHSFLIFTLFTYLFVCDIKGTKKTSTKDSGDKKRMMSTGVKQEITKKTCVVCKCLNW